MNTIFASLILILTVSCKSTNNQVKTERKIEKENTVLIAKGNLYGSGDEGIKEQNLVITNQKDWNNLLERLNSVNNVSEGFSETEIDFSNNSVIAVFDNVKSSGGHRIDLTIIPSSEHIIVKVNRESPKGMATTVMTQPYYIVKIAKSNLPIRFE